MKGFTLKARTVFWLLPALALFQLLVAPAVSAEAFRWKIATLAPKDLGWSQQVRNLVIPLIDRATNNNLRLKVYYGGVMGNDAEYLTKMRIGQLQGAGVTAKGSNEACPELAVLGLPFLFNNYDEVDYIRKVMFPTFDYYFGQNGFKLFMWFDQDFDQIYSTKYKMNSLEDFKKARFHTWYGPLEEAIIKSLGGSPVHLPITEGPTAFRTGTIDTAFAPALYMVASQIYTNLKYINTKPVRYAPAIVIVTTKAWETLPQQYRDTMEEGRDEVTEKFNDGIRRDNIRCIDGMQQYGIEKVDVDPEVWDLMRRRAMTVYDSMAGKVYPKDLLLEVQRHLAAYRKGQVSEPSVMLAKASRPPVGPKAAPAEKPPAQEAAGVVVVEAAEAPEPAVQVEEKAGLAEIAAAYKPSLEAEKKAEAKQKAKPGPVVKPTEQRVSAWETRRRHIRQAQEILQPMGLYPYRIDGIFGPITRKGIQQYQQRFGLPVTGAVDKPLLEHMGIE